MIPDKVKRSIRRIKWLFRYNGLAGVLQPAAALLVPPIRRTQWYAAWKETPFDRRFRVKTSGFIAGSDLDVSSDAQRHTEGYAPTSAAFFGVILEELDIDNRQYTFVDIGCGKGRVLLMAAQFPFSRIIGVELSASLCEIARTNIARFSRKGTKCQDIQCDELDATKFDFPATPLVVYLLNPFGEHILSQVLERLQSSWEAHPRDLIVIYCNPFFRQLFDASDFWHELRLRHGCAPDGWAVFRSMTPTESAAGGDDRLGGHRELKETSQQLEA